jgi:hypothetical protein
MLPSARVSAQAERERYPVLARRDWWFVKFEWSLTHGRPCAADSCEFRLGPWDSDQRTGGHQRLLRREGPFTGTLL